MVVSIVSGIVGLALAIIMGIFNGAGFGFLTFILCSICGILGFYIGKFLKNWLGEYSIFTSGSFMDLVFEKFNALYGPMISGFMFGQLIPLLIIIHISDYHKAQAIKDNIIDEVNETLKDVDMIFIPGGKMTSIFYEYEQNIYRIINDGEKPDITLTIGDFEFEKKPVSYGMYNTIFNREISSPNTTSEPREITWYEAIVFCNKLSKMNKLTPCYTIEGTTDTEKWGEIPSTTVDFKWDNVKCDFSADGYRLPTVAEYAYAIYASEYEYPKKYIHFSNKKNVFGIGADYYDDKDCFLWNWETNDYSIFANDMTGPKMGKERAAASRRGPFGTGPFVWFYGIHPAGSCYIRLARTVSKENSKNAKKEYNFDESGIVMKKIIGGEFECGSESEEKALPKHIANVNDFYISETKITEKEYNILRNNDNEGSDNFEDFHSIQDIISFCNLLSLKNGYEPCYKFSEISEWHDSYEAYAVSFNKNANGFRLPTEEEWEYAARGGENHDEFIWSGSDDFTEVVNTENKLVAQKKPNSLGLYDMTGLAEEWVWSVENDDYSVNEDDSFVFRGGHGADYREFNVYTREEKFYSSNRHGGLRLCRNAF